MIPFPPIPTKLLVAAIVLGMIVALCFVSYKYGRAKSDAEYAGNVAIIVEKARKDQEDLNIKLNEISHENTTSIANERKRIASLQRQLRDKPDTIECVEVAGRGNIAVIPDSSLRLLIESTNYQALPRSTDQSCLINEAGAVTASDLTEYTACIIGTYNTTAWQLTGLIDSVQAFRDSTK